MQDGTIRTVGSIQASARGGAENALQGPSPRRPRREVPNVVLRELTLQLRERVLLGFLDCVNLFRVRAVSRDERDVNLAAECVWFVFDSYALARAVPTTVLEQVQTSTKLRGLWATEPFPLEPLFHMQSKEVRTLALNLGIEAWSDMRSDMNGFEKFAEAIKGHGALEQLTMAGNNWLGPAGAKSIASVLRQNSTLQELNLADTNLPHPGDGSYDMSGVMELANSVKNNGALEKLNISDNKLFDDDARAGKFLSDMLAANTTLKELDVSSSAAFGIASKGAPLFARELAVGLSTNAALVKLNMSNNCINANLNGEQAAAPGKALADALAVNTVLKELVLSNNYLKAPFAAAFAVGLGANGALTKLNISDNRMLTKEAGKALADALAANSALKELDVSKNDWYYDEWKGDGLGFAMELAAGISANGALTSVNILENGIPVEQAQTIVEIMRSKDLLTTLCGLTGKETKLDFSNQNLRAGDAVLIANDIRYNGELATLSLRHNDIPDEQKANLKRICQSKNIGLQL